MSTLPQNYKNHQKFVPVYHYVTLPILLVNVFVSAYGVWRQPGLPAAWTVLVALALLSAAFFARFFALKAQDRLIRLEERLRMRELLPAELQPHIETYTTTQLVGLRFAGDAELPALAAAVRRDNIQSRDAIKQLVQHWRADNCRM